MKFRLPILFLLHFFALNVSAAEGEKVPYDEKIILFDYENSEVVVNGWFEYIDEHEPQDGIGTYGGDTLLRFYPLKILKGDMDLEVSHEIYIPNKFLSYNGMYYSRDQAFLLRQELVDKRLSHFSQLFTLINENIENGDLSAEDVSLFHDISDKAAREITALKPPLTIHTSPYRPRFETPIQKIIIPGNEYTIFLNTSSGIGQPRYKLQDENRSIFGGIENFVVEMIHSKLN